MCNHSCENSNYPDWPESFKGYYPDGTVSVGLLGSKIPLQELSGGPDPVEVKAWKMSNQATVTQVCEHFGLSRVQVVKVVGIQEPA